MGIGRWLYPILVFGDGRRVRQPNTYFDAENGGEWRFRNFADRDRANRERQGMEVPERYETGRTAYPPTRLDWQWLGV